MFHFINNTDEFIGWCCTGMKERVPSPNRERMHAISSEHQKKGYATKASKTVIDYLFGNTDVGDLNEIALIQNISLNKVIIKCGFSYDGKKR